MEKTIKVDPLRVKNTSDCVYCAGIVSIEIGFYAIAAMVKWAAENHSNIMGRSRR